MNDEIGLPDDVIAEIQANQKAAAIELLRAYYGIGRKHARKLIDVYEERHPSNSPSGGQVSEVIHGFVLFIILGVGIIYAIYRYFP